MTLADGLRRISAPVKICALLAAALLLVFAVQRSKGGIDEKLRAGIVMDGSRYAPGWYAFNFDAAERAAAAEKLVLLTADNLQGGRARLMEACDSLIRGGARLIVLTGFDDPGALEGYMADHSGVQFAGFDFSLKLKNYHPVFFRMYEARYLSGIVAALTSRSGILGYVAARAKPEVLRGVNAFALGAQSVRPKARVKVIFTGKWSSEKLEAEALKRLKGHGADVIAYHGNENHVPAMCEQSKTDYIAMEAPGAAPLGHELTAVFCDWDSYYRQMFRALKENALLSSLWIGLESGATGLTGFSPRVSKKTRAAVLKAQQALESGEISVFTGVLTDSAGGRHGRSGVPLSDEELQNSMKYLVKGAETDNE